MVIQRWQSLLLLAAVALMACFTFCSLGQVQTADYTFDFTSWGFCYEGEATDGAPEGCYVSTWYFFILSLTTCVLMLADIFMFNNLALQKKVCAVSILMTVAAAVTGGCLGYTAIDGGTTGWSSVALAPFLAIAACIMAWRLMNRDQNRLKAVDRIR